MTDRGPGASHGTAAMGSEAEKPMTAEDVPQPVAEEGPKEGESPPSARPKRLSKPDVSRHKAEVDEMHNKLKERKTNIDAINDKIRQMQSGGNRNPDNHLYDRLKKLRLDWDAALVRLSPFPPLGQVRSKLFMRAGSLARANKRVRYPPCYFARAGMFHHRLFTYAHTQRRWNCPPAGEEAWSAKPA